MSLRKLVTLLLGALIGAVAVQARAQPLTRVTFGTDWLAEAEHGGFYQALATGLYRKHGLDVTIRMGGPGSNPPQQVAAGVVDIQLTSGSFAALAMAQQDVPVVAVAAYFQKDPQVLIAHPGAGNDTIAAMRGKPVMVSAAARNGLWLFLKARFGFTDDMIRPYAYSLAPFLRDPNAIQEGFVSSEPYEVEKATGVRPVVHLLADSGFANYSAVLLVRTATIKDHPDLVRAFVEASTEGWRDYLANPAPGNALILKDNPDMSEGLLQNGVETMKRYGIVESGDALTLGIGAMTDERWRSVFMTMVDAGVYRADMDYKRAFTLAFVNQGYGLAR